MSENDVAALRGNAAMNAEGTASQPDAISSLRESLCSQTTPLPVKYRALFSLKHLASTETGSNAEAAVDAIAAAIASTSSNLLKHELAYCLGQTGKKCAVPHLRRTLSDLEEAVIVRHEAAEALGALGFAENLDILRQFRDRKGEDVAVTETCELAIDRLQWQNDETSKTEKLRPRYARPPQSALHFRHVLLCIPFLTCHIVISLQ
jgi:deoxyhypusine monooxygenase